MDASRGTGRPDAREEAMLFLEWARGSTGRLLFSDAAAPATPSTPVEAGPHGSEALAAIAERVRACGKCGLCHGRTHAVPGEGSPQPRFVVVGEAPGADEDASGRPFVGRAGQLLTKMLAGLGLRREDVFICNVLKCRPPENRAPRPDEVASCRPHLMEQLAILQPRMILALGSHAVRALLGTERGITSLRGRFAKTPEGWPVMPTYHPAYLLRNPAAKRDVWEDLKKVAEHLGIEIPKRTGTPEGS